MLKFNNIINLTLKAFLILFVFYFSILISQESDTLKADLKELEILLKGLPKPIKTIDSTKIPPWYLMNFKKIIEDNIPKRLLRKFSKSEIQIVINKEGIITKLKIIRSTGSKKIDGKLLKAINNSQPFGKIPASFQSDSLVITYTILGEKR